MISAPSQVLSPVYTAVHSVITQGMGHGGGGGVDKKRTNRLIFNYHGLNTLLGKRKKIAKFLMRTFTYRSTFLYV